MPDMPCRKPVTEEDIARARATAQPLARAVAAAKARAGDGAMVLAWISDLHVHAHRPYQRMSSIFTDVDAGANVRLALAELGVLDPDLLILGGDLADTGDNALAPRDEFEQLGRILREDLPQGPATLGILGNHDHGGGNLSDGFSSMLRSTIPIDWPPQAGPEGYYYERIVGGWRFLALDSGPDQVLSDPQRAWLAERTADEAGPPTVVLTHRPFVAVGTWTDRIRLMDRAAFDTLDACGAVRLVLAGHTHKCAAWRFRRKIHAVFGATAFGIGQSAGWGAVVLGADDVQALFCKELCGTTYEFISGTLLPRRGTFLPLATPLFEDSPWADPGTLPIRLDPTERD